MRKLRLREIKLSPSGQMARSGWTKICTQNCLVPESEPALSSMAASRLAVILSDKKSACQFMRFKKCRFCPWIGKIP